MPIASSGNVITNSSQLGADVVLTGNIKNGEIVNADLSAVAAIDASKVQILSVGANGGVIPSTGIVNAHLSGTAGITDANLAQITTASKVSGAALTSLVNIPAGAGIIPSANLPASTPKLLFATYDMTTASGTQNIAHGLGYTPAKVKIRAILFFGASGVTSISDGYYDGSTNSHNRNNDAGTAGVVAGDTSFAIWLYYTGNFWQKGTITCDGTNVMIAWTKGGAPAGTARLILEVI